MAVMKIASRLQRRLFLDPLRERSGGPRSILSRLRSTCSSFEPPASHVDRS